MSKRKLVVSLAVGFALVAAGWWAAMTFMAPPAYSMEMIAYSLAQQTAGGPVIVLRLGHGGIWPGPDQGPVPLSLPEPVLAKKNKVKGSVETMLKVDTSGKVAGIMAMHGSGPDEAAKSVFDIAHTWKFKPATEEGKPVPATVIVQVRF